MKTLQYKILCVATLAFAAMTACKSAGIGESPKETAGSLTSKETASISDPKTALVGPMKALQDVKSWIAEVDNSNDSAPQSDTKMQIKYSAPDSFQIETNTAGNKMQIIVVGGKNYFQTGDKWQERPSSGNMGQVINLWRDMFSDEKLAAFKNVRFAGKETVDGKELSAYTCEIDQDKAIPEEAKSKMTDEVKARIAERQLENKAKVWIDEAKSLPARMEITTKMSKPKEMTQKLSVRYIYDQEVKIEAPKLK